MASADLGSNAEEMEAPLDAWRRKAADVLVVVLLFAYLPGLLLVVLSRDLPFTLLTRLLLTAMYLALLVVTITRSLPHRTRVWVLLAVNYLLIVVANIALGGPYARAAPLLPPVLALVLLDLRAGRIATIASTIFLVLNSFLLPPPTVVQWFATQPQPVLPPPTAWDVAALQAICLLATLLSLMVPLERFYLFLLDALSSERRAAAGLRQEAARRAEALYILEAEMSARRRLERENAQVSDRERQRLGQEVHDGVCQEITGALLRCEAMERRLMGGTPLTVDDLRALNALLQHAIDDAQAVARGLWPLEADSQALARGLRALIKPIRDSGPNLEFNAVGNIDAPDPEVARHLYRIAQEAVSNAVRHAQATSIVVELRGEEEMLLLQVSDNGIGLPERPTSGGLGLHTMAYRAQLLGGELVVATPPEGGTRISCRVSRIFPTFLIDSLPEREGSTSDVT